MATIKRKSTVPFYAAAGVWVLYALLFPLYRAGQFVLVAAASAVVYFIMSMVCAPVEEEVPDKPVEEKPTGNAELDKMITDGKAAIAEMKRLSSSIHDPQISNSIERMEDVCAKIFERVKSDPARLPQIRKFMDYYLPTTLKILGAYDRMGAQGVSGENIANTMQRVEGIMGTIVAAFEKLLDSLFGEEALDITTDVTVLENLMKREGLVDDEIHTEAGTATAADDDIKLEL